MTQPQLSIIIASQHNPASLVDCLNSLYDQITELSPEVIVVTETDLPFDLAAAYPDLRLIKAASVSHNAFLLMDGCSR
jgi:hypothetical protein